MMIYKVATPSEQVISWNSTLFSFHPVKHLTNVSGTAAVAVAGIIASLRLSEKKHLADNTFVFLGAGEVCTHS